MIGIFKKDLIQSIRARDPRPRVEDSSDCRLLLELINEAYEQADDKKQRRVFLEKGIEFTRMSAEVLSEYARELGYQDLAQAYKTYSPGR